VAEHADCVRRLAETVAVAGTTGVTVEQMVVSGGPGEELAKLSENAGDAGCGQPWAHPAGGAGARFGQFTVRPACRLPGRGHSPPGVGRPLRKGWAMPAPRKQGAETWCGNVHIGRRVCTPVPV
jgi:hypothetical protein